MDTGRGEGQGPHPGIERPAGFRAFHGDGHAHLARISGSPLGSMTEAEWDGHGASDGTGRRCSRAIFPQNTAGAFRRPLEVFVG